MTRTEYNQRVITRKKRSILIKGSLGIAAFLMFASKRPERIWGCRI